MEDFKLGHVVLYSKHYYEISNDIFSDLKKCLLSDDYDCAIEYSNQEVFNLILKNFESLKGVRGNNISEFLQGVSRMSYLFKESSLLENQVRYIISCFATSPVDIFGKLPKPNFRKIKRYQSVNVNKNISKRFKK